MFRPEMLEPMGLPPDVRVLGWGLSLERPTMIRCVVLGICNDDLYVELFPIGMDFPTFEH
jgi:hypothetical protein